MGEGEWAGPAHEIFIWIKPSSHISMIILGKDTYLNVKEILKLCGESGIFSWRRC